MKAIEYRRRTDSDDRSRSPQGTKSHHKGKRDKDRSKNNTNGNNQLVLYKQSDSDDPTAAEELRRERAAQFLAMVNKGPESERGCSLHKTLKRFRRECSSSMGSEDRDQNQKGGERGRERGRGRRDRKEDDEQDLWRLLRLKRNDRGEIVLFI
jgi:cell growth-regulating nucleolar protein